ncbi:MAG TPA: AarF/UbiB family protein [Acidimicrobiales bacterium]|nr:AarF/UbiB family protein [Acidimicrobiales bacterium]
MTDPSPSLLRPGDRPRARRLRQLSLAGARNAVGLARLLVTDRGRPLPELAALQLRLAFQGLGPTFVKLGQLVSSSPGTFPQVLVEEFAHCQDAVPPEPWETVAATLTHELGDLRRHFRWIEWRPMAAGSIAQVYPATLADGREVVLKVQRSNLEELLREDLRMLLKGARAAVRVVPRLAAANPVGVIEDFAAGLVEELAFRVEAAHMDRLRKVLADWPIHIPEVHWDLTTDRVLTMERLDGMKVSDTEALSQMELDRRELADTILGSLLASALQHGFFHGDGHAGNMLVLADGTLGMLDFGIVGRLDDETRIKVSRLLAALVDRRFDLMAISIMDLADASGVDLVAATADLSSIAGDYLERPLEDIPLARLLGELLRAANRHGVTLPTDLVLLMKQILYLDGLGRTLNPGFDVFADGARFTRYIAPEVIAERQAAG